MSDTFTRFNLVHYVIKRALSLPFDADVPVNHEEMVAIKWAHPTYVYPLPEGYSYYFLGRRLVETD